MEEYAIAGGILMSNEVVLYSSNYCPYCTRAKQLLKHKGVQYTEFLVDGDTAMRQKMMQLSGSHTVPQIWVGNTHVGGCDDLFDLERQGVLDDLLNAPVNEY